MSAVSLENREPLCFEGLYQSRRRSYQQYREHRQKLETECKAVRVWAYSYVYRKGHFTLKESQNQARICTLTLLEGFPLILSNCTDLLIVDHLFHSKDITSYHNPRVSAEAARLNCIKNTHGKKRQSREE